MRIRAALVIGAAAAAAVLPLQPASAVCIPAYQVVTGRCSPCNDLNGVFNRVHDKTGLPTPQTECLA